MPAPAGPLSPSERLAFCASLAPDVAQVTAAYYDPAAAHPYLKSSKGGGILLRDEVTEDFETLTQVSVTPLSSDFIGEELITSSGLPEGITPDGILWSIITDRHKYPTRMDGGDKPDSLGITGHSWNYWDGKQWHTSRSTRPGRESAKRAEWVPSAMLSEEHIAIKAVAAQIRGLHQIAEVYEGDIEQFEEDMSQADVDPETRKWLTVAFASTLTMRKEVEALGLEPQNFMSFYGTGYQRTDRLTEDIPLGKQDDGTAARFATSVGTALANMYRGSAVIKRDSMRKRGYRARVKGHPLPLPTAW